MRPFEGSLALRAPRPEEKEAVAKYMRTYYASNARLVRIFKIICLVLGTIFLLSGFGEQNFSKEALFTVALGIVCLIGAIFSQKSQSNWEVELQAFEKGAFQVADGNVNDIKPNTKHPGVANVKFLTSCGKTLPGVYEVRQEDLEIGAPLLMVYFSKEESPRGKEFAWAFTSYMLTDEGIKKVVR